MECGRARALLRDGGDLRLGSAADYAQFVDQRSQARWNAGDEADIDARLQQMHGRRMSHDVWRDSPANQALTLRASLVDGLLQDVVNTIARQPPAAMTGLLIRRSPVRAQVGEPKSGSRSVGRAQPFQG